MHIPEDTLIHARYRVVRQIGRGGMGAVYEAVDTRLGNTVALKQTLVRGVQLDDAFAREARLLSSLRHAALPVVSDYFADGEGHFLVMQFIPGTDLATLMGQRSAPFSLGEVLPWADQLLDALDYLHAIVLGDGDLLGIPWASGDLVRLSAEGEEIGRIPDILAAADVDDTPLAVASDGLGTLYLLGSQGAEVFVFSAEGDFRDKFSVSDPTPFGDLAVDGQGKIYVPGFFGGVQVFAPDGRALGNVFTAGTAFDLTFDDENNLYLATNTPRIVKLRLSQ